MVYIPQRALELLRLGSGGGQAEFCEGQEGAIRRIVEGRNRLLVVQWSGESMAATSGQRRRVGAAEKTGL